ncbi:MAG TPA: hypothetical protein VGO50_05740 [Pyrinomonadaceae bacterium]|jgi:hypothetical protein|nr:hypothetical protein [Pyrinomonadaceae bacterium]
MRKSFFLGFLIILVCFSGLFAQAPQPVAPQWEYLVVAFGGPAGSPIITTEKDSAPAKVGFRQVYYGDKLVRFTDNASSQAALDELGKAGWELVSVIPPAEERPVSYIFKRPFERGRSQKELAEVAKLEQDAKAGKKTVIRKEPLVDLDRAEVLAADDAVAGRAKAKLEEAIKSAGLSSLVSVRTRYDSYSRETWAEVTVDGSGILLKDGNKFRTSEAKKYVSEIASELFKKSGLQPVPGTDKYYFENGNVDKKGEIVINLAVFVKYNGRDNFVGRGAITGNWMASNQQKE